MEQNQQDRMAAARTEQAAFAVMLGALNRVLNNPHKDGKAFVLIPKPSGDIEIKELDRPDTPWRKQGIVVAYDQQSFVDGVNRFSTAADSLVYASMPADGKAATFLAVLNDNSSEKAGWRDHRVSFELKLSEELATWQSTDKKGFDQLAFAQFVEENLIDFVTPEGAKMLELTLNFKNARSVSYKSQISLPDGGVQLEYADRAADGTQSNVRRSSFPEQITIEIPVFEGLGAKRYRFDAKLRYKVGDGGSLTIHYVLVRPRRVIEKAFADSLDAIRKGIGKVPLLFGSPGQ